MRTSTNANINILAACDRLSRPLKIKPMLPRFIGWGTLLRNYIDHTWGREAIRELVLAKGSIAQALHITEEEFYYG